MNMHPISEPGEMRTGAEDPVKNQRAAPDEPRGLIPHVCVKDANISDAPVAPAHQAEIIKDRRRPGRIHNVSPALIPLLRNPTGAVAGDLFPIDKSQIATLWAASAYPADVWRSMSATERSAAIDREMLEMVERLARFAS
jgi:hypothetical protein